LRKLLKLTFAGIVTLVVTMFGGPVSSGAVFFLLPANGNGAAAVLSKDYRPLHKGGVDFATGLYVREDEDVVIDGTPPLILRRTSLSNYQVSREFGIGATHNGEVYLHGDLREISLILASGSRITFGRTSPGSFLLNAMFEHRSSHEWGGSRLGWTGIGWALKRGDHRLLLFRGCGEGTVCSIVRSREPDGSTIYYRRDAARRLARMEGSSGRWIAFEYDDHNRIRRAHASTNAAVHYAYDTAGRLAQVTASDGRTHRYTYTDRHQVATIEDPDLRIENRYDQNGRCIKQTVHMSGESIPLVNTFTYRLQGQDVVQTDMTRSDGLWRQVTFNPNRSALSEAWKYSTEEPTRILYERDSATDRVSALTVSCPDRRGRPLRHTSLVHDGNDQLVKQNVLKTHCFSRIPQ
jgi:YD repeat-containing protein